jgi:predicted DNA-binding protein (UPF0251 family)
VKNKSRTPRKLSEPPAIRGFIPFGGEKCSSSPDSVVLLMEEYESLRLCDYENLNHNDASEKMCVSRPTFTRIYASALKKIARAMVEGLPLSIEGGKFYFDSEWHECQGCGCYFNHPQKDIELKHCPLCKCSDFNGLTDIKDVDNF